MPLFEAIINSIDAIHETPRDDGRIDIRIERETGLVANIDQHGNTIDDIRAFSITDNGAGFTTANYRSFETLDSRTKAELGAKGIGRILWLIAFDEAKIVSTYSEDGRWWQRAFSFRRTPEGIEDTRIKELPATDSPPTALTTVLLLGFRQRYRDGSPKSTEAVARRIVEHCLEYFLLDEAPRIFVSDASSSDPIDLNRLFREDYQQESSSRSFSVANTDLILMDVLVRASQDSQHSLNFCAHNRVVHSIRIADQLPHLDQPLQGADGNPVLYAGYVRGALLDERVDSERAGFNLDRAGELPLEGSPTWEAVRDAAFTSVAAFLAPHTDSARERSVQRIRTFIEDSEPKYRPLLDHRRDDVERLSGSLSDDRLENELHRILQDWRHQVHREVSERMQSIPASPTDFEAHRADFVRLLGELQEVSKSDLADYVVHRAAVLDFYQKLLGRTAEGGFALEDSLHSLFFPRRNTSDQIDFNSHNLWILDERLAYHRYLASDIPFVQQRAPILVSGQRKPDVLVYNQRLAYTPGAFPVASVVVIEFKRPERDDYSDEENPITQVLGYVRQIREGKAQRDNGSTLDPIAEGVPSYCIVVATLTDKLREQARIHDFIETPDRAGFFKYNATFGAYIEISSYHKVLEDAKKRNRAFFEKLQIHIP